MASVLPPAEPASGDRGFAGQTVAFTGRLSSISRQEAQALVQRLGGDAAGDVTSRTTVLVVGTERAADGKSAKVKRAESLNAGDPGRITILSEDEFCRLGGLRTSAALSERYYSLRQLRELYPRVHEARLRALRTCGLIHPAERTNADTYYILADVGVIKQINDELLQGRSFRAAVRARLAARAGQLALDFSAARGDARPAKVVALRRRTTSKAASRASQPPALRTANPEAARAASFFLEGSEYDEGNEADQERARVAYRRALLLDPTLVPAIVNLANIHYAQDELVEAQALYRWALNLDADCFEAHFNLGNIHHDLGRYEEAVGWYRDALRLNPTYADAHFYLAVTLEKMDRPDESKTHWQAYRRLAPDGEWADLVKLFSD